MKRTKTSTFFYELTGRFSHLQTTPFFVLTFLLAMCTINMNAQDVIIKKDGTEIEAKVQEINAATIKYKRFEMQDGPSYEINKSEVFMIKYPSGQKDVFNITQSSPAHTITAPKSTQKAKAPKKGADKKSAIGTSPLMFLFDVERRVGALEYERRVGNQFSVGGRIVRSEYSAYRYWEDAMGAGIFVRRYFNNNAGLNGFYIGSTIDIVSVEWGEFWGEGSSWEYEYGEGISVAFTSQLGYKIGIGKSFYIDPSISLGFYNSSTSSSVGTYNETGAIVAPLLTFGFRF